MLAFFLSDIKIEKNFIFKGIEKRSTYPYPTERTVHWLEDGSGNNDMEGSFGAAWLNC